MSDRIPDAGLEAQGIETRATLHWNLVTARLIEAAVARGEGKLSADGPLVVETGLHTGRSAQDKFIVRDAETESTVWWGKSNKAMTPEHLAALKADFLAELDRQIRHWPPDADQGDPRAAQRRARRQPEQCRVPH
ncbi:hypothetical protein GCM10009087_31280 [Sphingomonas oligophenolica]|uniref:Phosphoenolpyruvate carboxykinase (ATP) n=1 Tax=Sphingomonas oligophenolica TaxID=301154 RepID=A0ABU9YCX9_9SPHN